ncbi:GNAT family N-acetyltransferase [Haloplanus sp. GCM10025708]|uniref:GNAT family N-acetyltransferase n=1 Tax=Haloplanus sp. GCM10025708 TaxID=3252679 RepID=UPI003607C8E2
MDLRPAREDDFDAVAAFTRETWPDRAVDDYLPDVFDAWVREDDERQRTFVLDAGDDIAGVIQGVLLSPYEGWAQGLRVNPDYRGEGRGRELTEAVFGWARERGATVVRNLVFSWNAPSLGLSRRLGFAPCTEMRWAHPDPDPSASAPLRVVSDGANPDAAWRFWTESDARTHLRGLAVAPDYSWALADLTRERVHAAADDGRLLVVRDGGTRGFAVRNRTVTRDWDGNERCAEYAVAAWADPEAASALFAAVAHDAASVDADRTRVPIPETVGAVTDAAAARGHPAENPEFVLSADLTGSD